MSENVDAGAQSGAAGGRVTGTEAVKAHVTLAIGLALCVMAFWFELRRALGGNELSWAYVFEWPLLAIFALYMWWKVLHPNHVKRPRRPVQPAIAPEFDGMLSAWQDHQRQLSDAREGVAEPEAP